MARIRTIKPEFWLHEELSQLPEATHMLAAALLNYSDDEGYFNANPHLIKAACFPLRELSVSVQDSLILLEKIGYIQTGKGEDGKRYGRVTTFDEHQRVNRPTASKIAGLNVSFGDSLNTHGTINERSPPERKGKERKGKENREITFTDFLESLPEGQDAIPDGHKVFTYADKIGLPRDFLALQWVRFERYYGEGAGKTKKYLDWRAHFRTAVESNYGSLWAIAQDGSYYLTTAGKQLQLEVAND